MALYISNNVQFFIWGKTDILEFVTLKYSLYWTINTITTLKIMIRCLHVMAMAMFTCHGHLPLSNVTDFTEAVHAE